MYSTKNILFISYDGLTDPLGQSQIIPYLAGLSRLGYNFTILSCEKPQNYFLHKKNVEAIIASANLKWAPIRYHKRPPVLSAMYDVVRLRKEAKRLHTKEPFDMVHTRPGIPSLIGLEMKKKFGIKFLNDIREFYADSRIDGKIWNEKSFFYKKIYEFFKQKEKEAVEKNDGIVCLTFAAEKIIKGWPEYKMDRPIQVIPCSVDTGLFDPNKLDFSLKERFKIQLKIEEEDFIISYLGSLGTWYLIKEMMEFFKIISDKNPAAKFLFISPAPKEAIIKEAQKCGLNENKIVIKEAKRKEVPALLSFSKLSVFFIKSCYSKQSSSPTKLAEILAMGIPVITNSGIGDVEEIVEKYHSGIVLKELNDAAFKSIAELICRKNDFKQNEIRKAAEEFFNLDKAIEKYYDMYQQILT